MRKSSLIALVLSAALGVPAVAQASVVTLAHYRLGEADPGAIAGATGNSTTADSGPSALDMTRTGSPAYTGSVSAAASSAVGSSLAMTVIDGSTNLYTRSAPWTTLTDNFGLELWAQTSSISGTDSLAYDGNYNGGWGIYRFGDKYQGFYQGLGGVGGIAGNAVVGQWVHLALVRDGGVARFYVNGVQNGSSSSGTPLTPAGFSILGGSISPGGNVDNSERFDGALDEVRIFSFNPGQFSTADLLVNQTPEPATLALLALVPMFVGRRRR